MNLGVHPACSWVQQGRDRVNRKILLPNTFFSSTKRNGMEMRKHDQAMLRKIELRNLACAHSSRYLGLTHVIFFKKKSRGRSSSYRSNYRIYAGDHC